MDTRTEEQRRRIMQAVRSRDTGPEMLVRRLLHRFGYRYRLHRTDLPGKPDIVFGSRRKVIFVHGCFWHSHGCSKGRLPKSRLEFWRPKLLENSRRDGRNEEALRALGWNVLVIWQCETSDLEALSQRLLRFLGDRKLQSPRRATRGSVRGPDRSEAINPRGEP
ncbi:MAG: DNA mismatch endonuclease Vsr [Gemmatimonadetes bacterium]|nr:DNA mismatch endonuclease Vsr [Gemmatimonadota bacterium]MYF66824.1 DNA mismatch endonuclease Vsr [Gammaproteobacteria bacterium]MYJ39085.1 DNA mismatch endonuclease Vsr [Gemmatimonadota bacterium]